jgi:hypothetical protein
MNNKDEKKRPKPRFWWEPDESTDSHQAPLIDPHQDERSRVMGQIVRKRDLINQWESLGETNAETAVNAQMDFEQQYAEELENPFLNTLRRKMDERVAHDTDYKRRFTRIGETLRVLSSHPDVLDELNGMSGEQVIGEALRLMEGIPEPTNDELDVQMYIESLNKR